LTLEVRKLYSGLTNLFRQTGI